jgi:hypothetical protein
MNTNAISVLYNTQKLQDKLSENRAKTKEGKFLEDLNLCILSSPSLFTRFARFPFPMSFKDITLDRKTYLLVDLNQYNQIDPFEGGPIIGRIDVLAKDTNPDIESLDYSIKNDIHLRFCNSLYLNTGQIPTPCHIHLQTDSKTGEVKRENKLGQSRFYKGKSCPILEQIIPTDWIIGN